MSRAPVLPPLVLCLAALLTACTSETVPPAASATSLPAPGPADAAPPVDATPGIVDTDAVLRVEDQVSKGPTVNVMAAVTTGGWVVVSSEGGRNVLGTGVVPPGTTPQLVQVSLAEVLTTPTALQAQLYDEASPDGLLGTGDRPVSNDDADDDDDAAFAGETELFTFTGEDVTTS